VRNVRGACTFELVLNNLVDGLSQSNAGSTHFPFTEIIAPCFEMVIFRLSVLEGEVPSSALAREVMTVCMFAPPSIGAVLPSPRPWDFPPSIDGDVSREDSPMELDGSEGTVGPD
jgi:hypothetical protein